MPPTQLTQWQELLKENLPMLSRPQIAVLGMYSFAVASIGNCGLTSVATALGLMLQAPWQRLRQRLREFYKPAETKRGTRRRDLDVSCCFAAMLAWVVRLSKSNRVALGIDATTLSDRFVILSISVLYRATAIPVAWSVLEGNSKGAWKPRWLRMFQQLRPALGAEMFVVVCADRGLYARWLFQAICACGWHPLLRVNDQGQFTTDDGHRYERFSHVLATTTEPVSIAGVAFSNNRVDCTLLAYHDAAHKDAWLLLSDLPPGEAHVQWYGLRSWIEQGFKAIKRGAFQWQRTRMSDPARVERLWLVLSVATLLSLLLATRQEDHERTRQDINETTDAHPPAEQRTANGSRPRRLRLQRLGQFVLLALLCSHSTLGSLYLDADPWNDHPIRSPLSNVNEQSILHPP